MIATIAKQLVLKTTSIGVYAAVSALLHKAMNKVMPTRDFQLYLQKFENDEELTVNKEEVFKAAMKWLGVTLVIAIVAGAVASKAEALVEDTFWSDTLDQIQS